MLSIDVELPCYILISRATEVPKDDTGSMAAAAGMLRQLRSQAAADTGSGRDELTVGRSAASTVSSMRTQSLAASVTCAHSPGGNCSMPPWIALSSCVRDRLSPSRPSVPRAVR